MLSIDGPSGVITRPDPGVAIARPDVVIARESGRSSQQRTGHADRMSFFRRT
jgi:hypothetical protein